MSEPDNHTLRLLKARRRDMSQIREDIAQVDSKVDRVDKRMESLKQAAFGESILGRYAVAEVEERLVRIEDYMKLRES